MIMDYNESHINTTLKITSSNNKRMEELIIEMLKINGVDDLTARAALNSAALL